jgi:mono/diheme cytochrome c family protein
MHEGIRPGGGHLYPAFPYTYYTKLTRDDTDAIYAYLRTLAPVEHLVDRNTLPFPFNIRAAMVAWNAMFFTPGTFVPDPQKSDEFNRGAYLVQGAGHCGACHTPFNAAGANKASEFLEANQVDQWTAPNITNDGRVGLGKWSVDDIVTYLHSGRNATTIASGPMAEVVAYSTSQMPESDLHSIAVYLKERGAAGSATTPAPVAADDPRMRVGQAVYIDKCSACHTRAGTGVANIFPRLANNPIVQQDDPTSLVRVILTGSRGAVTQAAPTGPAMPSLGYRLNDDQVAAVLTYVRNSWGNAASPVGASEVQKLRAAVGRPR